MDDRIPGLANVDPEEVTTHQTLPAPAATDSTLGATATTVAQGQTGAAEAFVWPIGLLAPCRGDVVPLGANNVEITPVGGRCNGLPLHYAS